MSSRSVWVCLCVMRGRIMKHIQGAADTILGSHVGCCAFIPTPTIGTSYWLTIVKATHCSALHFFLKQFVQFFQMSSYTPLQNILIVKKLPFALNDSFVGLADSCCCGGDNPWRSNLQNVLFLTVLFKSCTLEPGVLYLDFLLLFSSLSALLTVQLS